MLASLTSDRNVLGKIESKEGRNYKYFNGLSNKIGKPITFNTTKLPDAPHLNSIYGELERVYTGNMIGGTFEHYGKYIFVNKNNKAYS